MIAQKPNSFQHNASPIVAVVGVGYVGEHLVVEFSKHYPVIAYDVNPARLDQIAQFKTPKQLMTTRAAADLNLATHILISVPTGVHHDGTIDTSILSTAITDVLRHAQRGATVVIESSVAVGMTRSLLQGRHLEKDLKIGMSPERVDPGRTNISCDLIPKIISGMDQRSLASITALYQPVFTNLVPVSSLEVAEMTKLYENCQRMVSIAYANEMADACEGFGIDPLEVCTAAATKPFGYQPYNPSLGVGGHCIPVNPSYLLSNSSWPFLEMATKKMRARPADIGDRIMAELQQVDGLAQPRILVVGVSFKRGQSVLSNAPGIDLIQHLLSTYDVFVEFVDPLVDNQRLIYVPKLDHTSDWNAQYIDDNFDAAVLCIDQVGLHMDVLKQLQKTKVFNFTPALPWSHVRPALSRSTRSSVSSIDSVEDLPTPMTPELVTPEEDAYSSQWSKTATQLEGMLRNIAIKVNPGVHVVVGECDPLAETF